MGQKIQQGKMHLSVQVMSSIYDCLVIVDMFEMKYIRHIDFECIKNKINMLFFPIFKITLE